LKQALTSSFYESAIEADVQCAATPVDTLEWISAYTLYRRCNTILPQTKSYVWTINDKGPDNYEKGSEDAVCQLPANKTKGNKHDIIMKGTCPEGSKCKCPMTSLLSRDNSRQIRFKGREDLFSMSGAAARTTILKQYAQGFILASVMATLTVEGLAITAAALATLQAPTFLVTSSAILGIKFAWNYLRFQCQQTLGCWPQRPDQVRIAGTRKACRMPSKTAEGGSPLWFLPPPLMKMAHYKGKCILQGCEISEMWSQQIGAGPAEKHAGNPNVYNCQPLTWEEMSLENRRTVIDRLKTNGIASEYNLPTP
jgi:hypothetical protein